MENVNMKNKDDIMYPRNIEDFRNKMDYVLQREKHNSRVEYLKDWLKWFDSLDYVLDKELDENYFLKPFYNLPDNFAFQVWKKNVGEGYDEVAYNLISNHYSIFNNENTMIVDKKNK